MKNPGPQKIQFVSKALSIFCSLALLVIPAAVAAVWFWGDKNFLNSGEPGHYFIPYGIDFQGDLSPGKRFLGFAISLLPNLVLIFGILHLRKLFARFGQLEFFSKHTIKHMKYFALAIFLYAFAYPLSGGILSVTLSALDPQQPTVLSLTAGHHELMTLFVGGVFLSVAWMMGEGKRLNDEIEQFV